MIAASLGQAVDLGSLRHRFGSSRNGATLQRIADNFSQLGLSTRAVRCDANELGALRLPCVLHWRFDHFVVLKSVSRRRLVIHDPARGVVRESRRSAGRCFTGIALEVRAPVRPARESPLPRLRLWHLVSLRKSERRAATAAMLLAFASESLLLTTPFYLQWVLDQVVLQGDRPLLSLLAAAFSLLLLFQVMATVLRQLTFNYVGHIVVFDASSHIVRRLLSLPLRYFRDRDLGDIQHRVQSIRQIQNFLVQSLPALVVDSVFVVLIVLLMLSFQAGLTGLILAATAVWCCWRMAILPINLRLGDEIAVKEATLQTRFLETLRAIAPIKLSNGERVREESWCNAFAAASNARIRLSNLQVADVAVQTVLFQGLRIALIFLLARQALVGETSIGELSAFVAYAGLFLMRGGAIFDRLLEYKLLNVPLARIEDIALCDQEVAGDRVLSGSVHAIELKHVSFCYADDTPRIINNCSARFRCGEMTAIAGVSGTGKSSLLALLAGVITASEGEVAINDRNVQSWSTTSLRAALGTVFQGDCLVKGSLAENIALSDPRPDFDRVRSAAAAACVLAELEALPMGLLTRVGDLASALSRGQVQRILLARAYYRRASLLLLDEVTSGLDTELEKRVVQRLQASSATRIVVTHSDSLLQAADSVLWLHQGRLLPSRPDLNV